MTLITFDLPAMYGDHHVTEVRRLLLALPGVEDVYASSAFHAAEIQYDPDRVTPEALRDVLNQAGYMEEMALPAESGRAVTESERSDVFFRHTVAYAETGKTVGFGQQVAGSSRPLWPCPGMGVVKTMDN